jgi:hypothetical protein
MAMSSRSVISALFSVVLGACTIVTSGPDGSMGVTSGSGGSGGSGGSMGVTSGDLTAEASGGAGAGSATTAAGGACSVVRLFDDTDFHGRATDLPAGRFDLAQLEASGMENDTTRSVCVPPGWRVTLFQHAGFSGESRELSASSADLGDFQGSTSSIVVTAP